MKNHNFMKNDEVHSRVQASRVPPRGRSAPSSPGRRSSAHRRARCPACARRRLANSDHPTLLKGRSETSFRASTRGCYQNLLLAPLGPPLGRRKRKVGAKSPAVFLRAYATASPCGNKKRIDIRVRARARPRTCSPRSAPCSRSPSSRSAAHGCRSST